MAKLLKISGRTLGILFELLLIFVTFIAFAIHTSPFQTYVVKKISNYLSEELQAQVKIDKVYITFVDEIALDGLLIMDQQSDTLIAAKTIYAKLGTMNDSTNSFMLDAVELENATIHVVRDQNGMFNYSFIKDFFERDKKTDLGIEIGVVRISNSRFSYDDNRRKRRSQGVDYFHIKTSEINATIRNLSFKDRKYKGDLKTLSLKEKSGFILNKLATNADVNSKGIFLSDLKIHSPGSKIESKKFNMLSTGFIDFKTFVDSIEFDAKIDKSTVALKEAALFAYVLDGMNDTIQLKTEILKKTKSLKLANLDLKLEDALRIKGTINLPDYRAPKNAFFHEKLDYAKINIKELSGIRLPNKAPSKYFNIPERVERLSFFEAEDIRLDGFYTQFVVASDIIRTKLGSIRVDNGIMFTKNEKNNSYLFERSEASNYDVKFENFNLGALLNNSKIGSIDGILFLSGEAFANADIVISSIEGNMQRFDFMEYTYTGINILEGNYVNGIFDSKIAIKDDNLNMTFDGSIDFKGTVHMQFNVQIQEALLDKLKLANENWKMASELKVDMFGTNPNNFEGTMDISNFTFSDNLNSFVIPSLQIEIQRNDAQDEFNLKSNIADINAKGKLDFNTFVNDFNYQLSKSLPVLFQSNSKSKKQFDDHIEYQANIYESSEVMKIFFPELRFSSGTHIKGHYSEENSSLLIELNSDSVYYKNMSFTNVSINQVMNATNLLSSFHVDRFQYNKSLGFSDLYFKTSGQNNVLNSNLIWAQNTSKASSINWETNIINNDHFELILEPSHFNFQQYRWEIANTSKINFYADTLQVHDFLLRREEQSIRMNGFISNEDKHQLAFVLKDIQLAELSDFISEIPIEGKINASGSISNPYNNFKYSGEAFIDQFKMKNQLVGDVNVNSSWIRSNQSIALQGDLKYRGNQTFDFIGDYYPRRKENNLDFNLFFDLTDIQFTNAFMDPDVISDIKGLLNGTLKVSGTPNKPILDGAIELVAGSAKVGVLGTHFGLEGPIIVDEYGFYINGIPIYDEDANAGLIIGSVYHDNFTDFNFDLLFDLETDAINKDPINPWMSLPLEKFLVLNSDYEPGVLYHGKGYATGVVNIFGYTDNLEITVDLETKKGTKIDIPMYGMGEIDTENEFIVFKNKDTVVTYIEPKIDFTGVDLNLNFKITPEADIKIIFNEVLEDEILARGKGDFSIELNSFGDVTMNGVYTVTDGVYDFAIGPVKQKFYIEKGGKISWTGDPYNALLDLRTYYKVKANIAAVTNDQFGSGSGSHQEILCYLDLSESLSKPAIEFDIDAPSANEEGKSIITRIKSDPDELNRQFFSLLLWKKFQPIVGSQLASGSTALDLVSNQINSMLSKLSDDYLLNINMNSDQLSGDNTYEFGVSKGFLNDRLILYGSFGVENQRIDETTDESSLIGDINIEYLLNESGTFRVNIFSESNDRTIIQSQEQGEFTQGVGLNYKEDFHTIKDFKAIQYFLDIFRKKENKRYPIKRKRRQVAIPVENEELIEP